MTRSWIFLLFVLRGADVLAILSAAVLAWRFLFGVWMPDSSGMLVIAVLLLAAVIALHRTDSYTPAALRDGRVQTRAFLLGVLGALCILVTVCFMAGITQSLSRPWIIATLLAAGSMMILARGALLRRVRELCAAGYLRERVVLVGATAEAGNLIRMLAAANQDEIDLVGVFDDRRTRVAARIAECEVLGSTDDLLSFVRRQRIERVVITLPLAAEGRINELCRKLRTVPATIDLHITDALRGMVPATLFRTPGITAVTIANSRLHDISRGGKAVMDVTLSLIMLLCLAPVLCLIALAIRLEGPGPILFLQRRYGFNNEVFPILKFRTMRHDPRPDPTVPQAVSGDPRVTRVGRILRRSSLDELPQLCNVLLGQMSLVGPRPHAVPHNEHYGRIIEGYFARHNVKPGITGWAQVNGLRGATETDDKMRKRVQHDLFYIDNWSLVFDLKIMLLTVIRVWFQRTAG